MYIAPKFISVSIAKIEAGMSDRAWKRFRIATGLKIYRIPGGSYVVDRSELDDAITASREVGPPELESGE